MATSATRKKTRWLVLIGSCLIALAFIIVSFTFFPVIFHELNYRFTSPNLAVSPEPVDQDFAILIPKIQVNSKVVADVDPFNPSVYQLKLTQGVAHAKGSSLPGQPGNVFIFSHSSVDFYLATRYNSIFYLLNKLEPGDQITIFYQHQPYHYQVRDIAYVSSQAVSYLSSANSQTHTLTLMTCWPPGTSLKRLIVTADLE